MSLKVVELDSNSTDSCCELQPTLSHHDASTDCEAHPTAASPPSELTYTVYLELQALRYDTRTFQQVYGHESAKPARVLVFKSTVARIMLEFTQVV